MRNNKHIQQGKLSLHLIKRDAMKMYGEMEV
jgi:hypothetical protein